MPRALTSSSQPPYKVGLAERWASWQSDLFNVGVPGLSPTYHTASPPPHTHTVSLQPNVYIGWSINWEGRSNCPGWGRYYPVEQISGVGTFPHLGLLQDPICKTTSWLPLYTHWAFLNYLTVVHLWLPLQTAPRMLTVWNVAVWILSRHTPKVPPSTPSQYNQNFTSCPLISRL